MYKLPDTLELKHPRISGERRKKGTQSLCYQQDLSNFTVHCLMSHDQASLHAFLLTISRAVPCWESAPGREKILFTKLTRRNFKSCADSAKRARLSEAANLRLLTADNRGLGYRRHVWVGPMMRFLGNTKTDNCLLRRRILLWKPAGICNHRKQKRDIKQYAPLGRIECFQKEAEVLGQEPPAS